MAITANDKRLGMDRTITRRDFLDGIALSIGGAAALSAFGAGRASAFTASDNAGYPPKSTGLQGQTEGSRMMARALRDGSYWGNAGAITDTGEAYDLVVVGAGISGLAAAFLYRQQAGADKRVLLIDPLDAYGGHAKRNEFSAEPVDALNDQQKVPLLYTNVALRNWEAFDALKIEGFTAKGMFWSGAEIDFPVSMGSYKFADKPSDPVILHLSKVMVEPGLSSREQALAGKRALMGLTFEDMERDIRDMLDRALAGSGFDAARDIEGITVNRWAHGYMHPWDAFWPDGNCRL